MPAVAEKPEKSCQLPTGWRLACVGEILKIRNGYAFKSTDYKETGVPLIRQSELKSDVIDLSEAKRVDPAFLEELPGFIVQEGDLLIGMSGSLGKIAEYQNKDPALQNQRTGLLIMKPGYDAKFARLVLKLVEPQIVAEGKGVAVQNVSAKEIEACTFLLPLAKDQRRIVAEIEQQFTRLDAGVAALRRTQANLKRYRAAVLKAACEGRLVPTEAELARQRSLEGSTPTGDFDSPSHGSNPQPRKRGSIPRAGTGVQEVVSSGLTSPTGYETGEALLARILTERRKNWTGPGKYKDAAVINPAHLPPLPNGWTWASMREVGEVQLGRQRAPQHHTGDNMRPYLRVANVFEAHIDTNDVKEMNFTPEEFERYQLRYGDILLNEGQTPELVGRPAMFRNEITECCYQKTLLRFRSYAGVLPAYALTVFRSYMHNRRFTRAASITTNIAHLTAEKFVEIEFPLPPLAEQTRIVAEVERRLSVVDEFESVVKANFQRATRLRQSILQQAFTQPTFVQL